MPRFTRLLVMSMDARKVLGCSKSVTIRLKEGCWRVLKTFISFWLREKKATSLPAIKKESINKIMAVKINTPVTAGIICKKTI